jgi:hypothetical protein
VSDDELLERVAAQLRRPVTLDPALDARVMAEVQNLPPHGRRGAGASAWRWLVRPRTIRVTPIAGIGALAAVLVLVFALGTAGTRTLVAPDRSGALASTASPDSVQVVQFVFISPDAHTVSLVGDFNGWETGATPLRHGPTGEIWTVDLPLEPGRHRYAFVVDGRQWAADPTAPPAGGDDFGVPSSVVTVTGSSS